MKHLDKFLDYITTYRLVLYCLTVLAIVGIVLAFLNILPFSGRQALISLVILIAACWSSNALFGYLFKVPLNIESHYITAFILFLTLRPPENYLQAAIIAAVGVVAMASKYVLNIKGKHIFNPAVFGLFVLGLSGIGGGSWWVASSFLLPFTLITALLIWRKTRRGDVFFAFAIVAFVCCLITGYRFGLAPLEMSKQVLLSWPLVFFGSVMLTEPLTSPPTKKLRIIYGSFVGVLFGTAFNFGVIHNTPELALVVGNIFSYFVSPKEKLILQLKEKIQLAPGIYDFVFKHNLSHFAFAAGQYLEWTLPHEKPDTRGVRRYFTIASSPTEQEIHLGAKFYDPSSTYKKKLISLKAGDVLAAGQLAGDFTLPSNDKEKIVFIAGGIGVTPFRSMVKYLLDKNEKRDVVMYYSTKTPQEVVYKNIFDEAATKLGAKVIYTGIVTEDQIKQDVPDYLDRTFYISGPHVMVEAFRVTLQKLGVKKSRIKIDFFPGYV